MKKSYLWAIILLIVIWWCAYAFKNTKPINNKFNNLWWDEKSEWINILSEMFNNNDDSKISYDEVDLHSHDTEFRENAIETVYYHYSIWKDSFDNHRSEIEIVAHWVEYNWWDIRYNVSFILNDRNYHASLDKDLNVTWMGSWGWWMLQEAVAIKDCWEDILYTSVYTDYKSEYNWEKLSISIVYLKFDQDWKTNKYSYTFESFSDEILEKSIDNFIDEETAISIVSKDSWVKTDTIRDADNDTWFLWIINWLYTQDKVYNYQFTDDKWYTYIYELSAYDWSIISKDKYKDIWDAKALDIAMKDSWVGEKDLLKPSWDMSFYLSPQIDKVKEWKNTIYKIWISTSDDSYYLYEISAESWEIIRKTISKNYVISNKSWKEYEVYPYKDKKTKITININDLWIDDIFDYKDFIYLRLQFESGEVVDWWIIDIEDEETLWKLSADELFEEYYFDKKYNHIDSGHLTKNDKIELSKLKEWVIYDYYVEDYCDHKIINDLGKDIIVYWKEIWRHSYDESKRFNKTTYLKNDYYGSNYGWCWWREGYTYSILYKTVSTEDILKVVAPYQIYYLSSWWSYNVWDEIDRDYNMYYIYNDTKNNIKLKFFNDVYYRDSLDEWIIITLHPDEWADTNSVTTITIVGEDEVEWKIPSKPITKKIATKYINWEIDDSEMRKYKSIDVEWAQMLAQYYTGNYPELWGLETLDAETAAELAKFKGTSLRFKSLKSLDAEVAKELAKFNGLSLDFDSLESINSETAAELANYSHMLFLNWLKTLDAETAAELAKFKGSQLWLESLTDIDVETAEALSKYKWYHLYFKSLKKLTPEIVVALNSRDYLYLEWFSDIDVETAFALAKFSWDRIHLGITEITPDIAKALARFNGEELWLDSLTSLDKESARYLARFRGKTLRLMWLMKIDDETIKHLSTFKWQLDISNRNSIKEKIEEEKILANSDSKSEAEAKIRDTNRKNNLAQIQTAIIVSQMDKWYWPGKEKWVIKWIDISSINTELLDAWMYSVPSDPIENSVVKWLWNYSASKWEYWYMVSSRNWVKESWFILMAKLKQKNDLTE